MKCLTAVAGLTPRQREVLVKIAECKPRKVIASELGISPATLKVHVKDMHGKLGVYFDAPLVRIAVAAGLVSPAK
jgi:DNA-binding NarL/FixJ family response regulator